MTERLTVCLVGLVAGGSSGVARYTSSLTMGLDRVAGEFPGIALTFLTNPAGAAATPLQRLERHVVDLGGSRAAGGPVRLAIEHVLARRARGDLLYFFDTTGPILARSRPFVTTAHDATIAYGFNPVRGGYKRRLYPWALRRARAVVAVSAFARDEVVRHFGADPARIHVIHSGPGLPAPDGTGPSGRAEAPFLLYVGNLAANKNLPFLVRAFGASSAPARLVLAGRPGEGYSEVESELRANPRRSDIEVRTDASDSEIESLYRAATALVLPSLYEGFGFTPLEAMSRDCPVVASDIPALREISGDGALLVPLDESAWARTLERVASDERVRAELRERGRETAARYSWDETARGVCRLLVDVGASV
ncbi:MAG TPA: glycosyltransferase family 1 protein [Gaiellaceae bacterium]|nr:glycosyltransferase family 1 protein [Gaiellaceae bacterium]